MRRFCLTLSYQGTHYAGWQVQPNAVTVQQFLQDAIGKATGENTKTIGSGRTDAGVHAQGQVVSFSLQNWSAPAERLVPAINLQLPEDIACRECCDAQPFFHAIRDAISKRYRYVIRAARPRDALERAFHWHVPQPIDFDRMVEASSYFKGTQDFAAFQSHGAVRKSTIRTVYDLTLTQEPAREGRTITMEIEANGFLYNMVRNIVGSLVRVGMGTNPPDWIQHVRDSRMRRLAGVTAPAAGLCLMKVHYPETCFCEAAVNQSLPAFPDGSQESL